MKIIAHRANFGGPKKKNENQLSSIETCIGMGYDVEIDIRYLDGKFFLTSSEILSTPGPLNIKLQLPS